MGYVGNQQTEGFSKIPPKQDLTGATGSTLTLSNAVSSPESIDLFINNVRQEPTESYTTDGTTVNLVGYTVAATDDIYVVYNSLAKQTSTHPSNQALQATTGTFSSNVDVGGSLLVDSIKEGTGTNTAMTIDGDGRVGFANPILVQAYKTTTQTSAGIMIWNNEVIDTANAYDHTTGQFTCPKAGYYEVSFNYVARNVSAGHRTNVRKNGVKQSIDSSNANASLVWSVFPSGSEINIAASTIVDCAANDLLDVHLTTIGAGDIYGFSNGHNNMTIRFLG